MLKRLIFKQEPALHLGLPTLVWNVRIRLVWVSRESGGKLGRTQYLHLSASPQMLSVCVWGFEGKCLCQWHPPLVSIQHSQGQMKQNHLRRRLISTTQLTEPTWILFFPEKMLVLAAMFLGLSSVDVRPGVPWWQHWGLKTVGPTVDTSHILRIHPCCRSDGSFQGQHPCWGEQRSTCSQVDGSKQEYSWQLTWGWRYRRRVDRLPVHMWSVLVTKPHNVHNFLDASG